MGRVARAFAVESPTTSDAFEQSLRLFQAVQSEWRFREDVVDDFGTDASTKAASLCVTNLGSPTLDLFAGTQGQAVEPELDRVE